MDRYLDFATLQHHERDFTIEVCDRGAAITILAPHGGTIEPHTTEIARLIAGPDYNYFFFNGTKQRNSRDLHITSHRWDEPQAAALVARSSTVLAVHGCVVTKPIIYLGGRDILLKGLILEELAKHRLTGVSAPGKTAGQHRNNICNRGSTGRGVQLEIARPLRDDRRCWPVIGAAVRAAITRQQERNR